VLPILTLAEGEDALASNAVVPSLSDYGFSEGSKEKDSVC